MSDPSPFDLLETALRLNPHIRALGGKLVQDAIKAGREAEMRWKEAEQKWKFAASECEAMRKLITMQRERLRELEHGRQIIEYAKGKP